MERRKSLKHSKGHPLFTQRYQPPIQTLNSDGESTGGSSEVSMDEGTGSTEGPTPYARMLHVMQTDPKWSSGSSRMVGMYRIHGEIGTGNFARVRLGVHQLLREKVAVKVIEKSRIESKLDKMLGREVSTLESLHHPNIVRLYEVIETPFKLYLISEWAPAGDLYAKVTLRGHLSERETRPIFTQILSALMFMHGQGVVHRDLKAENIFFSTGTHCKVGDFGFATVCSKGQLLSTFCGSPPYAAPELFRDENYEGCPVDVWALGVLLFFMTEGTLPFIAPSIPTLKAAILQGTYEASSTASEEISSLFSGILEQNPRKRMTLSEVLRNPWLRSMRRQDTSALLLPAITNRAVSTQLPTPHQLKHRLLSVPEQQAISILTRLGVPPSSIERHRAQGVRSGVGGIYRILLHRLQQGLPINPKIWEVQEVEEDREEYKGLRVPSKGVLRKQVAYEEVQQSTSCNIL